MDETKELTRDEILALDDLRPVEVPVPEWGGVVYVRPLTAGEFAAVAPALRDGDVTTSLVATCVCDGRGRPLFTIEDVERLAKKSAAPMQRIAMVAGKLNGLHADPGKDEAGA